MKERLQEIDVLRGLAFLAVVLQHVIGGLFYLPDISPDSISVGAVLLAVIRFAVPLFVFITGVVLFYNYDNKIDYKSFIRKRFSQVVLPYSIWTVFYFVWIKFLFGLTTLGTWNAVKDMGWSLITGTASYHLWFMVMIIPFYFLFPLFRIFISKNKKLSWNVAVVIAFLVFNFVLLCMLSMGVFSKLTPKLSLIANYLDRNFIFWVFYFILGGFAGIHYKQFIVFIEKIKNINLLIWLVSLALIFVDIKKINNSELAGKYILSANVTSPLDPVIYLFLISSILLMFWVARLVCNKMIGIAGFLNICGKYSFGAYLIHAFVLKYTNKFVIQFSGSVSIYLLTVISFVFCSVISILICVFISKVKIPLGESIIGKI